ncbi:MAG: 1,2-phenylacetyl-CoA epoxidase subunit PaaC, partial [Woeseiaceae bacterium]
DCFYRMQLESLADCRDAGLAAIAVRAGKEIQYHLRHASQWLVRLGDGTDFSHARAADSLQRLWRYSGEMFEGDAVDEILQREFNGPDLGEIAVRWRADMEVLLAEATLAVPEDQWMDGGGRDGRHSEHFGYLLAEMQHLHRSFPGASW